MKPLQRKPFAAQCANAAAIAIAIAAACTLSACSGSSDPPAGPAVDARSSLAFGACVVEIADPSAVCGTLTVAEDRADPASRLIGLPFVVLPATATAPAADPVVIFTGGPGPSPLQVVASLPAEQLQQFPVRQKRDVIVMTQRGTDLTTPQSLDCGELALDFAAGERFASAGAVFEAATACRDRLLVGGVKLDTYTTRVIARDMEDLRVLLGARRHFTQWNVVGSSYGSKLAQVYLRDTPQGVRSVVLDGPSPLLERDLYYAGQLDALSAVIAACDAQPDCAAAYPNLQARFGIAIEALEATPGVVRGVAVRGHALLNAVRGALSAPQAAYANLPLFMHRVAEGDLPAADALLPFTDQAILAIPAEGMFYTVTCTDSAGPSPQPGTELPMHGAGWPDAVRLLAARNGLGLAASTCPLWAGEPTLAAGAPGPLRSDVPALVTVGQFDGATPATSVPFVLAGLSRARAVVFTGRGHGLLEGDPCMLQVVAEFIDEPLATPDTSCLDAPQSLHFVTPVSADAAKAALQQQLGDYLASQPLVPSVIAQVESPADAMSWSGAVGVIDRSKAARVTPETAFRIASVTKTFTSAAVHRLAEQGQLGLDDPVAAHLLPGTAAILRAHGYETEKITLAHLLAHTSGLPNHDTPQYQQAVLVDPGRQWSRREQLLFALDRFAKAGAPGEAFEYSDTGYILLGEIIETRTGTNLGAAYRKLLDFDRLGMASTWMEAFEPAPPALAGFAHAYADIGLDLRFVDASADTHGGGGLVSTVGDLTRFFRALFEGRLLSPASLASMQTQSLAPDSRLGRGIFLLPVGAQDCWAHEGFWGVGVYYCPATRVSVALTINLALTGDSGEPNEALTPAAVAAALIEGLSR